MNKLPPDWEGLGMGPVIFVPPQSSLCYFLVELNDSHQTVNLKL
jgi:hypothetical protein